MEVAKAAGLQQTSGWEKEGKAAKLTVLTFVYCST
jgi:hypothetical protein